MHLPFPHEAHDALGPCRGSAHPVEAQDTNSEPIGTLDRDAVPLPDRLAAPGAPPHRRVEPEIERELLAGSATGLGELRHEPRGIGWGNLK